MFKRFDICIVLFLVLNACYWFILNALNSAVSPYVYFLLPAIFIVPAAMFMNFSSMVVVCAISACATASAMPINMFAVCAVWLAAGFAINAWRFKFRALDIFSSITVMQFVNMFVFAFYVLLLPVSAENYVEYIKRVACDFAFSGLLLCLCANFCLSLPVCIMSFFGVDIMSTEDVL
ncbi:MAG: hypothetical protein E7035_02610 [Verrucomicrobiaceae bacterium]|nr:hypothetical protein [Verrucomicrobiaceae bacterium]